MSIENLSEDLHAKLDQLGAPPREKVEIIEDEESSVEGETLEELSDENPEDIDEKEEAEPNESAQQYRVADLAKAIGWEAGDLYRDLIVPLVNGETLSLGEMKDRFNKLAEKEVELERLRESVTAQATPFPTRSDDLDDARARVKAIELQYDQVPWETLEQQDAGKAANLRQKFMLAYQKAKTGVTEEQTKLMQNQQQQYGQLLASENQRLLELVPEWKDESVFRSEQEGISKYLTARGIPPQVAATVVSAGARAIARDAWLWNKHQTALGTAQGKVRNAPKRVLRPSGVQARTVQDQKIKALEQRALESGRRPDQLNALRAIVKSAKK